jgi:acyl-CoA reductase-like NAD-dependent aldehyde dehydrogenase
MRVADRMATGTVYINKCAPPCADAAWIGCKQSGLGVEGTKYGLENFTQLKHISIDLYP